MQAARRRRRQDGCRLEHAASIALEREGRAAARASEGVGRSGALRVGALLALSAIILAAAFVASASASQTRPLIRTFGGEGSTVSNPYPLSTPQGIAVDRATEDVYVADTGNHRVEKFDTAGNFLLTFGGSVGGPGVDTCTSICQAGTAGSSPGEYTQPRFLAIDNSAGPSAGDVYVVDTSDNLVSKLDASGKLSTKWGAGGQLSGSSTGAGSFGEVAGIAVGPDGTLYVLNKESQLFKFGQDGTFSGSEATLERGTEARGLGVDQLSNVFKVNGDDSVEKFNSSGGDIGQITLNGAHPPAVEAFGIDPTAGDLYVASEPLGATGTLKLEHYAFNSSGHVIQPDGTACENFERGETGGCAPTDSISVPFEIAGGLAFASGTGDSYVSNGQGEGVYQYGPLVPLPDAVTGAASDIHPTAATLGGTVNPEGVELTECNFEYGPEEGVYTKTAPCTQSPAQIGSGIAPVAVTAEASGLAEGATYHFRLNVANQYGPADGADHSLTTTTPPAITAAAAANLARTSADLLAQINPDNGATVYHIEYGSTKSYGVRVPAEPAADPSIGEGSQPVAIKQHIAGLEAGLTYHFRVVAKNAAGTTTSPDHTFVYSSEEVGLPDGRAYEMVTPAHKNAALIGDVILGVEADISEAGSSVVLSSIQPFAGSGSGNANRQGEGEPYAFKRSSQGWTTTALAPPATQFSVNSPVSTSAEAETTLFTMPTAPGGEDDFYVRPSDGAVGTFNDIGPATPPADGESSLEDFANRLHDATADLSHLVYESKPTWSFDETEGVSLEAASVYGYTGTGNQAPTLIGVKGGPTDLISKCGTVLGGTGAQLAKRYGSLSKDGSKVYFTALRCPAGGTGANEGIEVPANELYAHVEGSEAVAISTRSAGECTEAACLTSTPSDAEFEGASADGTQAFFTSTQKLTDSASEDTEASDTAAAGGCHATTGANGCNLYEYDFARPEGQRLIAVSAGAKPGEGPEVQGVMAISPDGSHVYFVAKGALSKTPNSTGGLPTLGAENLYVSEVGTSGEAKLSFITTLAGNDSPQWEQGVGTANVTPDGRYLVFTSHGKLTPDDTRTNGAQQVFRYDAVSGLLTRISIGNDGFNDNGNAGNGAAIVVPAEKGFFHNGSPRADPTMSNDGSYVFFQSPVGLTSRALNDVTIDPNGDLAENVYEYHEGRVYLISDGRDVNSAEIGTTEVHSAVYLLGTDATGDNVFFTTADQLVPQDTDTQLDYYDAHICSSEEPCVASPVQQEVGCREGCLGPPSAAPASGAPGSSVYEGPGNPPPASVNAPPKPKPLTNAQKLTKALKACHAKRDKKKRAACEAQARKKYAIKGKKAAKKSQRRGN